jgi:hypothetical protein
MAYGVFNAHSAFVSIDCQNAISAGFFLLNGLFVR